MDVVPDLRGVVGAPAAGAAVSRVFLLELGHGILRRRSRLSFILPKKAVFLLSFSGLRPCLADSATLGAASAGEGAVVDDELVLARERDPLVSAGARISTAEETE